MNVGIDPSQVPAVLAGLKKQLESTKKQLAVHEESLESLEACIRECRLDIPPRQPPYAYPISLLAQAQRTQFVYNVGLLKAQIVELETNIARLESPILQTAAMPGRFS